MLVALGSRTSMVSGKALGGASIATVQGPLMLVTCGFAAGFLALAVAGFGQAA